MPNLTKPNYPMPAFVRKALDERELMESYRNRRDYQQNECIGWIRQAKRVETQFKRLNQMLNELERGDKYMNMDYKPKS